MMRIMMLVVGLTISLSGFANTWTIANKSDLVGELLCEGNHDSATTLMGMLFVKPNQTSTLSGAEFKVINTQLEQHFQSNHCPVRLNLGVMANVGVTIKTRLTNNLSTVLVATPQGAGLLTGMQAMEGVYNGKEYLLTVKKTGNDELITIADVPLGTPTQGNKA